MKMETIEKICTLLEKKVLAVKGFSGIGIVDYDGNGERKIEVAVQDEAAREIVLKISQEPLFKDYPISVILPGKTVFL